MRQAIDQIEVDRAESEFADPAQHFFSHRLWLDAMHCFLDLGVEILDAERGAVETGVAQGDNVIARKPAGIDLHARLNFIGELKMPANDFTELADFIRS